MGSCCCKGETIEVLPPKEDPPTIFELASEIKSSQHVLSLQSEELQSQKRTCESVLSALHSQKTLLSDLVSQLAEARSECDHWRHCFEAIDAKLSSGHHLAEHLSSLEKQCEGLRDKLNSIDSDDFTNAQPIISQTKAEVTSLHGELRRSHAEVKRLGSGQQQQPEVFEFREVVGLGKKSAAGRYTSYSRVSREPHLTAEETMSIESESSLRSNILTHIAKLCDFAALPLYDLGSTKLIVSALMKEKELHDLEFIAQGLRPQSFPDFLVYIMVKSSKQSEGSQHVAMLMKSFKCYYDRSLQPGILFAKLFHLYHTQPVGYQFAVVVPRFFAQFGEVAERKMEETTGKQDNFQVEFDDRAWLTDVLHLVYSEFGADVASGTHLLLLLKPGEVKAEDYHHYLLLHKYSSSGLSLQDLIPPQKTSIAAVSTGLKRGLDLWMSDSDLQSYLSLLDHDGDGELSRADLKPAFDLSFSTFSKDERYSVSCLDFIFALETVARERDLRMTQELVRAFGPRDEVVGVEEVWNRLQKVCPGVELESAQMIFGEVRRSKAEVWALDVVRVLLRFPLPPWDKSPLARSNLLSLKDAPKSSALLADSGNILEEQNEDD